MKARIVTALAAFLALSLVLCLAAAAATFWDAAKRLDGTWRNNAFELRVDAARAQASIDRERPFHWQRFVIKEVTDQEILFTVGAELFTAVVTPDGLTLTGTNFRGKQVLLRQDSWPALRR